MKRISVCIATYNGGRYIEEQLESILKQLNDTDEVIVSDDSSIDDTVQRIKSFNDPRIIVLENQKFRNPIYNFENALRQAHGEFIILADQDDLWLPGRVDKILPFFCDFDLVLSDCKIVNEELLLLKNSFFEIVNARSGFLRNLIWKNPYIGCCMAFKREVLKQALPFPRNIPMHDFWIGMIAELHFKTKFLKEPLLLYRRHSTNASLTSLKSSNSFFKKVSFRIQILKSLIVRNCELFMMKRRNAFSKLPNEEGF